EAPQNIFPLRIHEAFLCELDEHELLLLRAQIPERTIVGLGLVENDLHQVIPLVAAEVASAQQTGGDSLQALARLALELDTCADELRVVTVRRSAPNRQGAVTHFLEVRQEHRPRRNFVLCPRKAACGLFPRTSGGLSCSELAHLLREEIQR